MMCEDQRSRLAEDYRAECEQWEEDAKDMRARGLELKHGVLCVCVWVGGCKFGCINRPSGSTPHCMLIYVCTRMCVSLRVRRP